MDLVDQAAVKEEIISAYENRELELQCNKVEEVKEDKVQCPNCWEFGQIRNWFAEQSIDGGSAKKDQLEEVLKWF
jgi:hypothetical protein